MFVRCTACNWVEEILVARPDDQDALALNLLRHHRAEAEHDTAADEAMRILDREEGVPQRGSALERMTERNDRQAETIRAQMAEILRLNQALRERDGRIFSLNVQAQQHRAERKARGSEDLHQ